MIIGPNEKERKIIKDILVNICGKTTPNEISDKMLIKEELGIDSLKFIRLIMEVEIKLGKQFFNVDNIGSLKRVEDLYHVSNEKTGQASGT